MLQVMTIIRVVISNYLREQQVRAMLVTRVITFLLMHVFSCDQSCGDVIYTHCAIHLFA